MQRYLQGLAWLEGTSTLLLFFGAMPLKYAFGHPEYVRVVGMIHGLLFLTFVTALTTFAVDRNWPRKNLFLGYLCSVLPFGPFWFDRNYLKKKVPGY